MLVVLDVNHPVIAEDNRLSQIAVATVIDECVNPGSSGAEVVACKRHGLRGIRFPHSFQHVHAAPAWLRRHGSACLAELVGPCARVVLAP